MLPTWGLMTRCDGWCSMPTPVFLTIFNGSIRTPKSYAHHFHFTFITSRPVDTTTTTNRTSYHLPWFFDQRPAADFLISCSWTIILSLQRSWWIWSRGDSGLHDYTFIICLGLCVDNDSVHNLVLIGRVESCHSFFLLHVHWLETSEVSPQLVFQGT